MEVPHIGLQKDWFTQLIADQNAQMVHERQDEVAHYCCKCMHVYVGLDGVTNPLFVPLTSGPLFYVWDHMLNMWSRATK
jgi:hypothetical protein